MNIISIELIIIILYTTRFPQSIADNSLYEFVQSLKHNTSCSNYLSDPKIIETPIYLHNKYPILNKIITNQTLSVFYNKTLSIIEQFLIFFDHYFLEITRNQLSKDTEKIKYLLSGLLKIDKSIKSVGLCLDGRLYHSNLTKIDDYICKYNIQSVRINDSNKISYDNNIKIINENIQRIRWEPVICSLDLGSMKYPIRLLYLIKTPWTNTASTIYFEFNISEFKLDQCAHTKHRCHETTTCIYNQFPENQLFSIGNYYCRCQEGFFMGQKDMSQGFPGNRVEKSYQDYRTDSYESEYYRFQCEPCKLGCSRCNNGNPCMITYETKLLRGLPLAIQSFCITMCIVTGIIIFQLRRTRVVKSSNWILLELFLFGAVLIYCTIINAYFVPSELTCAIQPFLREGGFVLMYGVLYVKVYRVLCSFQSRKAQRVYVRDQDILRYLGVLIIICMGHLIAWLATGFDHRSFAPDKTQTFSNFINLTDTSDYLKSKVCTTKFWEIVSYLYETGLLALTIYYCKCVKSAPSEYGEVRFITIAVINELLISLIVIITRMVIINTVHPDYIFLIHFIHCHATATISVLLLIGPKMWYLYRPPVTSACKPRLVPHTESHIIQTQQKLNGDVDLVEINLAEMDCETIRDELKRLYTQLEIYKTRAMRKDNPHVSRKRGGRKQRRFSLQHFHKKHHATSVHDDETSKISEDSAGNSGGEEATLTSSSIK